MNKLLTPQILLVSILAGWLNREQQKILEYLREENRVLTEQLGSRLRLTDEQRRRLAAKGKACRAVPKLGRLKYCIKSAG